MPLAVKKNQRTEKQTPAEIDVLPTIGDEQPEQPSTPKVTALIYSYNNASALRRCIAALEKSSARAGMEILVVDKGSQDESPGLDAEFPETTFLRLPRNFGNTKALNIGLRTAVGELIFFLNPEVEVAPDTVARLLNRLESDQDSVALCPLIVDERGAAIEEAYRLPSPQTGLELIPVPIDANGGPVSIEYATFQALFARKYFIRGINYFDEKYGEFGADAELCYQIQRAGRKTMILPDVRVVRRMAPAERSASAESLLEADRVTGIAVYLGKHFGFFSGLLFRIGQIFKALFALRFSLLMSLVSGDKVDGSQSVTL